MSQNVDLVRRGVEAFRRGDIDAFLEELSDDVVFDYSGVRGPYRGIYLGREDAREILAVFWDAWESITPLSTEYIEVGDKVVLALRARFQGRGSGVEVEGGGMGAVLTLRNGKIVRYQQCQSKAEALEAAGMSE
jgi:ketosteroid isomerase-like protein